MHWFEMGDLATSARKRKDNIHPATAGACFEAAKLYLTMHEEPHGGVQGSAPLFYSIESFRLLATRVVVFSMDTPASISPQFGALCPEDALMEHVKGTMNV
jgi:hypothetical protein